MAGNGTLDVAAMLLLEQALDRPESEREAFIRGQAGIEERVRRRALELLESDKDALGALRTGGARQAAAEADAPPPAISGYRFLEPLGRGGMGTVWRAQRDTGDFDHQVAIKVIKPGILSDSLIDRFRRERQILARLNHPNIAHLHDGGETADGQPYIVMEYVAGQTLRGWLAAAKRPLDARLAMFGQIAEAVGFAHQNLVIHRDLTPNNVLVTPSGQAKLIDFGIARPQTADAEAASASTFSGLSLTPGFAAPERSKGTVANTLSDIYSLGKILELMTGTDDAPELDAISARAAAEQPDRRYAGVGALLEDLARYREGQPVPAFSTARSYRFRKFLRRERMLVVAAAALLVTLVAGLGGTGWAYYRSAIAHAESERRFAQVRDLARFQLFDLYDRLDNVVGNTAARVALTDKAQAYLAGLAASRTSDRALQLETADGFVRLARIQGVAAHPNFGESARASENLRRAEDIYRGLATDGVVAAQAGLARALAYQALNLAHAESKPAESRKAIAGAEAALQAVPTAQRDWEWMLARRVVRLASLEWADLEVDSAMLTRGADALVRDIEEWPADRQQSYEARFDRALTDHFRAIVDYSTGEPEPTRAAVRRYLAADRKFAELERDYPNDPLTLYRRSWNAYYGYGAADRIEDDPTAETLLRQARTSVARLMEIEENDQSLVTFAERLREAQAEFYSNIGRIPEAVALQRAIVADRAAKVGPDRQARSVSDLAYAKAILGTIHRKARDRASACASWGEAERLMAELAGRNALSGYVADLRAGVQANIRRCRAGDPVTAFRPLASP